jgi:hypothetical protein
MMLHDRKHIALHGPLGLPSLPRRLPQPASMREKTRRNASLPLELEAAREAIIAAMVSPILPKHEHCSATRAARCIRVGSAGRPRCSGAARLAVEAEPIAHEKPRPGSMGRNICRLSDGLTS